jgi:hypothetical protein
MPLSWSPETNTFSMHGQMGEECGGWQTRVTAQAASVLVGSSSSAAAMKASRARLLGWMLLRHLGRRRRVRETVAD